MIGFFSRVGGVVGILLIGSSAWAEPVAIERLEASVNSELVLLSDIAQFRRTVPLRAQLDPLFAGTKLAQEGGKGSSADIIQFLIQEKLILQRFPISDTDVEQEIKSIQASNRIDRAGLKSALSQQGFDFSHYFELIRISIAKRNLIDRDIRTKVTISDDDVKNYFYNHYSKSGTHPQAYQVKLIRVSPSSYKSPEAAREIAQKAKKALDSGDQFEEVARRFSDGPNAKSGGDLGVLTEDQMSPFILKALKNLKIGQTSNLITTSEGDFMIVKLADLKTTDSTQYEKLKEEIRGQLATREYQRQIELWLERHKSEAFIHRAGNSAIAPQP